jgi:hypothetical protein
MHRYKTSAQTKLSSYGSGRERGGGISRGRECAYLELAHAWWRDEPEEAEPGWLSLNVDGAGMEVAQHVFPLPSCSCLLFLHPLTFLLMLWEETGGSG